MDTPHPITVTVIEAQRLSGLGATTLWELIRSGQLETVRVGRRRLVVFKSLETLLQPGAPGAPKPRGRPREPIAGAVTTLSSPECGATTIVRKT